MTTMNISLPEEMKAFVETQMAHDGFASASEYLRALIREEQRRQAKRELEAKLLAGLEGPVVEMTRADWESIRQEAAELHREIQIGVQQADQGQATPLTDEVVEDVKARGRKRLAARKFS